MRNFVVDKQKENKFTMKRIFIMSLVSLALASCHESLEDKAEREAKEYTRKNWPMKVAEGVVNDSMTFDRSTRTIHYYYSLTGDIDKDVANEEQLTANLVKIVKEATNIRKYKENGFSFSYTYHSTKNKGKVLYSHTITPKDYQ